MTPDVLHPPILESRSLVWSDESDCAALARRLAARPELRDAFIALDGPLGAGKTTFVRHLLRALGVSGRIKSPTFAVLESYDAAEELAISHFDFYRFDLDQDEAGASHGRAGVDRARAWHDSGFREHFAAPGLKLAEWPERAGPGLPPADLRIELAITDDQQRAVTLIAHTPRGQRLLDATADLAADDRRTRRADAAAERRSANAGAVRHTPAADG